MSLTVFQTLVLQLLADHRSPNSHVAGGLALNSFFPTGRLSRDLDIFHDTTESVSASAAADAEVLTRQGYQVEWQINETGFKRARVSRDGQSMLIDWARDSAFRYFPAERDETLGWRLHLADLAANKALALAARSKTRDLFDIVLLDKEYLRLEAVIWAACGKDEGFNPQMMLELMKRNARVSASELKALNAPIDPCALKQQWLEISDRAMAEIKKHAADDYGFLLLDHAGRPCWFGEVENLRTHYGTTGGTVPAVADE